MYCAGSFRVKCPRGRGGSACRAIPGYIVESGTGRVWIDLNPKTGVVVRLTGMSACDIERFLNRFRRAFQRGGG